MATEALDAAAAGHDSGASAGMPQLDVTTWPNQIFWLLVALVVIYLVLTRVALPRIGGVLGERRGTITNDLLAAEELKQKAQNAEKAYNEALAKARAEAQKIAAETRAAIQADLDVALKKADAEIAVKAAESAKRIAEIRDGALESVTVVAKDVARDIVASFGLAADGAAVDAAVTARLKG